MSHNSWPYHDVREPHADCNHRPCRTSGAHYHNDAHLQGPRTGRTKFGEDEVGIPSNFLSDLPAAMA